jgi:predicted nuclease of predicted toxin-antitoxin system
MRVLLDECLPVDFRHDLAHVGAVETSKFAGFNQLSNGALLTAMAGRYDVLITRDRSIRYQHVIAGRPISVVVLRAPSNDIIDLKPLVPAITQALAMIKPGTVVEI